MLIFYHPVHTVLALIIVACGMSGLLLKAGAEFLGLLVAVVYIGAVVVLFLFCVFMISIRSTEKEQTPLNEGFSFLGLVLLFHLTVYVPLNFGLQDYNWIELLLANSNLQNFNTSLFHGSYNFSVIASGFLLLVSMVGAIFLTIQDYRLPHTVHTGVQLTRSSSVYNFKYTR